MTMILFASKTSANRYDVVVIVVHTHTHIVARCDGKRIISAYVWQRRRGITIGGHTQLPRRRRRRRVWRVDAGKGACMRRIVSAANPAVTSQTSSRRGGNEENRGVRASGARGSPLFCRLDPSSLPGYSHRRHTSAPADRFISSITRPFFSLVFLLQQLLLLPPPPPLI